MKITNKQNKQNKLDDIFDKVFEVKKEIPDSKVEFYLDQTTERKLYI